MMHEFSLTLPQRLRKAELCRKRYQTDPEYRERRRKFNAEAQRRWRERQRERVSA